MSGIHQLRLHERLNALRRDCRLRQVQPVGTVGERTEIQAAEFQQRDRIVQTVVLVEVGADRNHFEVDPVVADHLHNVLPLLEQALQGHDEGGIATLMRARKRAVYVHARRLRRSFETQECGSGRIHAKRTAVMRLAAVIGRRTAVHGIRAMGHRDLLPGDSVPGELPAVQISSARCRRQGQCYGHKGYQVKGQ